MEEDNKVIETESARKRNREIERVRARQRTDGDRHGVEVCAALLAIPVSQFFDECSEFVDSQKDNEPADKAYPIQETLPKKLEHRPYRPQRLHRQKCEFQKNRFLFWKRQTFLITQATASMSSMVADLEDGDGGESLD